MSKAVILCVDDERMVLDSLRTQLSSSFGNNYIYEAAEDADEALDLIQELSEDNVSIVVIISDWLMPGMKGDELLINIHQKYPQLITVLLTGQADKEAVERAQAQANLYAYLHKPWNSTELIKTIKSALGKV